MSRVAILGHALVAAETSATHVCLELSALVPRQDDVERVQIEASGAKAMPALLGRELNRAPWEVSEGRCALIGELIGAAQDAARLVRVGLGAIAERLVLEA